MNAENKRERLKIKSCKLYKKEKYGGQAYKNENSLTSRPIKRKRNEKERERERERERKKKIYTVLRSRPKHEYILSSRKKI